LDVADPRALRDVLRRHGVRAATSLGQRFLVDRAVLAAIVDAADLSPTDDVLEIGPGPGVLTAALAARVRSVTAVEVDPRMIALLEETLADHKNVRVVQADALKVDLLGIRERGYLSVFTQSFAEPRIVRRVPARAFRPAPRVDSAVVALRTRPRPAFAPLAQEPFLRLVSDAFRHRRKQVRSALGHEAGLDRERATAVLAAAGIAPDRRPETLSLDEWIGLAHAIGLPEQ